MLRRRIHVPELEDQPWLPAAIRDAGRDYLRFMTEVAGLYRPIASRLRDVMTRTGYREVLDLCSGGGGPVEGLQQELARQGCQIQVTLSDKFPNLPAFRAARKRSNGSIGFVEASVDAEKVSAELAGIRTLFSSLHHLSPASAQGVLRDAVAQKRPVAIFDLSARTPPPPHFALMATPVAVLALTPWVRPFRWSRLFWTYLVPLVPLVILWDGLASGFRLYSTKELEAMVADLGADGYRWDIGREGPLGSVTYLIGYPTDQPSGT